MDIIAISGINLKIIDGLKCLKENSRRYWRILQRVTFLRQKMNYGLSSLILIQILYVLKMGYMI